MSHFHLDLFGNYIPGLCSGLAIARDDLGKPIRPEEYPILTSLFHSGINGLYDFACEEHGFAASGHYLRKCDLCFEIRRYLVLERSLKARELQPRSFYENA